MQFEQTALSREMQRAIQDMGFTEMTEVQEKTIPEMMEGKDVIAKAPTGTGKTCAFGVPIIERIDGESDAAPMFDLGTHQRTDEPDYRGYAGNGKV